MKVNELKAGMNDVSIKGKVIAVSAPRNVNTRFGQSTVADATLEDDTGSVSLTLWRDQISLVSEGDTVEVTGGYTREWNGALQVAIGRGGAIKKA